MFGKFGLETMKWFNNLACVLLVPHHPVYTQFGLLILLIENMMILYRILGSISMNI